MKNSVILKLRNKKIVEKLKNEGITNLYIFGSYLRKEENLESDIDLLYEKSLKKMTFSKFLELKNFLEENLGKKVDFIDKKYLNKYYKNDILEEAELIF